MPNRVPKPALNVTTTEWTVAPNPETVAWVVNSLAKVLQLDMILELGECGGPLSPFDV